MRFESITLQFTGPQQPLFFRELNGHDELLTDEGGTIGMLRLLDNIIVPTPGYEHQPLTARGLTIADRDVLVSKVYQQAFGVYIESTLTCTHCNSLYDIRFSVDALRQHLQQQAERPLIDTEGFMNFNDEVRFRLPTGEDELAVMGMSGEQAEHALLQRCIGSPVSTDLALQLQDYMEKIAPVLFIRLNTSCPECKNEQALEFDMQSFLLNRLRIEKKRAALEVHCLAVNYQWSHKEILDLPRSLRKTYASILGLN